MTNQPEKNSNNKSVSGSRSLMIAVMVGLSLIGWQVVFRSELHSSQDRKTLPENWPDMRLNINSATSAELTILPGIGDGLAEKIVAYRITDGDFHSIYDLDQVPRIGIKTIDRIKRYVVTE